MNKYIRILGLGLGLVLTNFVGATGVDPITALIDKGFTDTVAITTPNAIRQALNLGLVVTAIGAACGVSVAALNLASAVSAKIAAKVYDWMKDERNCWGSYAYDGVYSLSMSTFMVLYGAGIYTILQNMPALELVIKP